MKSLIGYSCVILLFAGLVLPIGGDMTEKYKHEFNYDINEVKEPDTDSITKRLDSLVDFNERNIKYLNHTIKEMR